MKDIVVIDASIAVKWVLKEHDSSTAMALLNQWTDRKVIILAPALLAYEATNTFYKHIRRGAISVEDAKRGLKDIIFRALVFDRSRNPTFHIQAIEQARQFGLPATYDAHYLALAERQDCELWTADTRLWNSIRGKFSRARWMEDYHPTSP